MGDISYRFITYVAWSAWALMVALACASLGSAAASAATGPKVAQLTVAGPDTIQVKLESGSANGKKWDEGQAHLVVFNTGEAPTVLSARAFLDAPTGTCSTKQAKLTQPASPNGPVIINPGSTEALTLTMRFGVGCAGSDGTIVISGGPGVAPVTTRFSLARDVSGINYWLAILISGGLALVFVIVMITIRRSVLGETVQTGPGWSFNDSWLTNITALGAILGTVLASTGFLSGVLPGISTGDFTGLSLVFGGIVVAAPIIYAAASKWQFTAQSPTDTSPATLVSPGRVWGVLVAAGFTLWGVFGELATMIDLTVSTNSYGLAKAFVIAALGAAAGIATWYAVAFAIGVSEESKIGQPVSHIQVKSGTL